VNKKEFIKSKVDSIEWDCDYLEVERKDTFTMEEKRLYAKSYYDKHYQHIGTICYDRKITGARFVIPAIFGKDKYYYYNRDKMQYYKTCPEAENYSKNQYIKSVKLKANWQYRKENQ